MSKKNDFNDFLVSERDIRLFSRLVIKDENYVPPSFWYHDLLELLHYLEEGIEYDISSFISKENQEVAMYYLENIAFIKTDEEDDPDYRICLDDTDDESDNKLYELMIRVAPKIRILSDTQFIIEYSAFYRKLTDSQRALLYMKKNAQNKKSLVEIPQRFKTSEFYSQKGILYQEDVKGKYILLDAGIDMLLSLYSKISNLIKIEK